jgi:hypothetical protein
MTVKPLSEKDYHQVCDKRDVEAIIGRGFHEPRLKELFAELKERRKRMQYNGEPCYVQWSDVEELFGPLVRK